MASTKQFITRFPTGGMDQSAKAHVTDPSTWWELLNLRPVNGALEQTKPITTLAELETFVAEADSPVRHISLMQNTAGSAKYFVLTENTARYITPIPGGLQTQIPFVLQVTIPNRTGATGYCLLYGLNATDFAATGDYIQVEILTGTTARWRRNAGSWTTFTIATSQAIGSNGLYLAFLTTTGFTAGDIWQWQRYAAPPYASAYPAWPVTTASYNRDIYIAGLDRHIMRLRKDFISTVGYKRVYGRFVAVYYNHLVIGQFCEARYNSGFPSDNFDQETTPWIVGWSDLNDPDEFYATDINEADQYSIPSNDSALDHPHPGITGMEKWQNQLIIFLSDEMIQMNYVGLPLGMKLDSMNLGVGCFYPGSIVKTPQGLFFWSRDNICVFNGAGVRKIGYPVKDKLYGELNLISVYADKRQQVFAFYDKDKSEIVWTYWVWLQSGSVYQQRQVIYQLDYNRFYFRNIPSASSGAAGDIRAICRAADSLGQLIYGTTGALYQDYGYGGSAANIVTDVAVTSGSPTHTQPTATTPDLIYGDLRAVKEHDRFLIDAVLGPIETTGVALAYSSRASLSDTVSFTTVSQTWTPTLQDECLSLPRISGRVFRFKFTFTGAKPYDCSLNAWGDFILQTKADV